MKRKHAFVSFHVLYMQYGGSHSIGFKQKRQKSTKTWAYIGDKNNTRAKRLPAKEEKIEN